MSASRLQRIAGLSPKQRALFALRRRQQRAGREDATRIPRRQGDGPWPASADQTALWFFHQLEPRTAAYNIGNGNRVLGPLDVGVMERSLNEIVRRHEVLRTTFEAIDGQPYQVVAPSLELHLPVSDLRHLPAAERRRAAVREVAGWIRLPFDLETGPLLRMPLVRLDDEDWVLVVVMHHTITDWWSYHVFFQELFELYESFRRRRPARLEELPIQFIDYALWRNRWLESEECRRQGAYWRRALAGAPTVLELHGDRPRPAVQSFRGAREFFEMPLALVDGVRSLNRLASASTQMTLLATTFLLLHRITGVRDILIGTAAASRELPETKPLIGYLLNSLVMRGDLSGDPSFLELLGRIRRMVLGAFEHKDYPFRTLVEELQPARDLSRMPVYQVEFLHISSEGTGYQGFPEPDPDSSLAMAPFEVDRRTSPAHLQFAFVESPRGLYFTIEYGTDLFEAANIRNMGGWLMRLLEGAVADPEVPVSRLPWLDAGHRRQLLETWNTDPLPRTPAHLIHELVACQAAAAPEAPAVTAGDGDRSMTYRQLLELACRLAGALRRRGVGPESVVGVCLPRAPELPAAILGVLEAGGCYLPLDPELPDARLAFLLDDAGAEVVVTTARDAGRFAAAPAEVLALDRLDGAEPARRAPVELSGRNAAYMIYTSGSTGRPKGVVISHRSAAHFLGWMGRYFELGASSRILAAASVSFDLSIFELLAAPVAGGLTVLVEDLLALPRLADDRAPTLMIAVPTALQGLLEVAELPAALDTLGLGGEALHPALLEKARRRAGHVKRFFNLYGPTEATVASVGRRLADDEGGAPPIGRPLAGIRAYVVDRRRRLVPAAVPGELLLAGRTLARGYHRRPGLTAVHFVPDRWSAAPGERAYATGDLVRRRPDGEIVFLGRIDHQVKVRGFRIEVGEIESVLSEHPAVREAAVVVHRGGNGAGPSRLVAYVAAPARPAADGELQRHLSARLPAYMVPAAFVPLDELPVTASGKVDRAALEHRAPSAGGTGGAAGRGGPPRNATERALAAIWSEVLGRENIGADDNFFELGGDSILSVQVVGRARRAGLHLTSKHVFQEQTLAGLARCAGEVGGAAEQGVVSGPAELTPIQRWFFEQGRRHPEHFNLAGLSRPTRPLRPPLLRRALEALTTHHDALRLRFPAGAGGPAIHAKPGAEDLFNLTLVGLGALPAAARATALEHAAAAAQTGLDLADGPLIRAVLFDLEDSQRLLIVVHHLLVDAVSWQILSADFATLYRQLADGREPELSPKTTSWQRWTEHTRREADSEATAAEIGIWRRLAAVPAARLPAAPGAPRTAAMTSVSTELDAKTTRALLHDVPPVYNTRIEDLLLTALALAWCDETGGSAVRFHLERHGRDAASDPSRGAGATDDLDLSRTVGWFTVLVPVVLALDPPRAPGTALTSVKEQLRRIPRGGLGYGLLRYGRPGAAAELGSESEPELSFNYLGRVDAAETSDLLGAAGESVGPTSAPGDPPPHRLAIEAVTADGRLGVDWRFDANRTSRATIERLAGRYLSALEALVAHCLSEGAGGRTPSDFPLADLDQATLDALPPDLEDVYPLTGMQEIMVRHYGGGVYHCQLVHRIRDRGFSPAALAAALSALSRRNPALRTTFVRAGDRLLQVVRRRLEPPATVVDLTACDRDRQHAAIEAWMRQDRRLPFKTDQAMLRWQVFLCSADTFEIALSIHHGIIDGWSYGQLLAELAELYAAARSGGPAAAGARADVCRERVVLDREIRRSGDAEGFWQRHLAASAPFRLERRESSGAHSVSYRETLPDAVVGRVRHWQEALQVTFQAILLSAFLELVRDRYETPVVTVGLVSNGRSARLSDPLGALGLFWNMVPFCCPLRPEPVSTIRAVQERLNAIAPFTGMPLAEIEARRGRGALFFATFNFVHVRGAPGTPAGEGLEPLSTRGHDRFHWPLNLSLMLDRRLELAVDVDPRYFDPATVHALAGRYRAILEELLTADRSEKTAGAGRGLEP